MMKLIVICITVLAVTGLRECAETHRTFLRAEAEVKVLSFRDYMRHQPSRPSLQIVPKVDDYSGHFHFPNPPPATGEKEKL